MIIEKDGVGGLFGRGLRTKILTNAIQVGGANSWPRIGLCPTSPMQMAVWDAP